MRCVQPAARAWPATGRAKPGAAHGNGGDRRRGTVRRARVSEHISSAVRTSDRRDEGARTPHAGMSIDHQRRYRLRTQIGEGGMGVIWRARDEVLERDVAIKFLKPDVPQGYRGRFRREAKLGADFVHPNLVRVLDAGALGGVDEWMAMDYLEGNDLGGLLEDQGRLGPRVLLDVFDQALAALSHVHDRRVVHRDVKPYNLFLAREHGRGVRVKLIDFGICRNFAVPEPADEQIVGDPRYMPPEQAALGTRIDGRTDLYALGISLIQAATGRHPYEHLFEAPVGELLHAHAQVPAPVPGPGLPASVSPPFARGLDEICRQACARDPAERFATAAEMRAALAELSRWL